MNTEKKILVVGETFLDENIIGEADRLSPEAPVPVFNNGKSTFHLGGAANVAKNLANLGVNVYLLTALAKDRYLSEITSLMKLYGVNLVDTNWNIKNNMRKIRFIVNQQQLFRYDIEDYIPDEIAKNFADKILKICSEFEMIIFSDYAKGLFDFVDTKMIKEKFGKQIIIDSKSCKKRLISYASILKPNISELRKICNLYNIQKNNIFDQALEIKKLFNLENLLVTLGSKGMIALTSNAEKIIEIDPFERDVYDVTGAGDTVTSVLGFCMLEGDLFIEAAKKANYVASIAVTHLGTYTPKKEDLFDKDNKTVVFTNGCFDILHIGHISLLNRCKELGSKVIVGLNSDSSVKRLKGKNRPFNNEKVRKKLLESLSSVDEVIIFEEDTPYELICRLKPNNIVKGGDYEEKDVVGAEVVKEYGGKVIIFDFIEGYSTSKLAQKIEDDL